MLIDQQWLAPVRNPVEAANLWFKTVRLWGEVKSA
jgi:hypothetical protein